MLASTVQFSSYERPPPHRRRQTPPPPTNQRLAEDGERYTHQDGPHEKPDPAPTNGKPGTLIPQDPTACQTPPPPTPQVPTPPPRRTGNGEGCTERGHDRRGTN